MANGKAIPARPHVANTVFVWLAARNNPAAGATIALASEQTRYWREVISLAIASGPNSPNDLSYAVEEHGENYRDANEVNRILKNEAQNRHDKFFL